MMVVSPMLLFVTAGLAFAVGFLAPGMEDLSWFTLLRFPPIIIGAFLLAGILGVSPLENPKKVVCCICAGIALLICNAIYFILLALTQEWTTGAVLFFFGVNSIIPVRYIIVAYRLKHP